MWGPLRLAGRMLWYAGLSLLMLVVFLYNAAVLAIIDSGFQPNHPGHDLLFGLGAEVGLVLLGLSPPGQAVAGFLAGFRRPTDWERYQLESMLARVRRATGYRRRVVLHVLPVGVVNGFALGTRHLAITRAAFNLPPDELEAIVAHEVGHLAARHNLVTSALSLMSIVGSVVQWLAFWMGMGLLAESLAQSRSRRRGGEANGMGGAFVLLAFFAVSWCFTLILWALWAVYSRQSEYEADGFAARHGYGPALSRALGRLSRPGYRGVGLTATVWSTHPATRRRLARIERQALPAAARFPAGAPASHRPQVRTVPF